MVHRASLDYWLRDKSCAKECVPQRSRDAEFAFSVETSLLAKIASVADTSHVGDDS